MDRFGKYRSFLPAIPVLVLCAFSLFYRLDTLPIRQWDEARNAVSALEMLQNHNYIVRYFDRSPDYWDVKPPLLIWMQVLSLKFFGLNETAIRLPSALAALLTVVFVLLYFKRYHRSMIPAFLAVLILVTSPGYMGRHVARTGDHDALLVLFTTAVLFLSFEFLYAKRFRYKLLVGCAVGFFLGILTKSVAIFMILPGLATMTFFFGRQKRLLFSPAFHISLAVILLLTSGYYLWRESLQPGYFRAVWNGELFPRYLNANSDFNSGSFFYYMKLFFTERYPYWIYFMLASVVVIPFIANHKTKAFAVFLLINALMYLVVISAGTKNMWYDAPLYPLFATIIGMSAYDAMLRLRSRLSAGKSNRSAQWFNNGTGNGPDPGTSISIETKARNAKVILITAALAALVFFYPSFSMLRSIQRTTEYTWDEEIYGMGHYLSEKLKDNTLPKEITAILFNGYNGHLLFYTEAFAVKTGRIIPFRNPSAVRTGDIVLLSQQELEDNLSYRFRYEVVEEDVHARLVRIISAVPPR